MQKIQIQTINSCNAQCIKCPNKDIYQTNKIMEDDVFLNIIHELVKLDKPLYIDLFLQNEPLMDPLLFERIDLIKDILDCGVRISTNCLLLPKHKKQILSHLDPEIDKIGLMLHGWDAESYNITHGTNITQDHYNNMKESVKEIKLVFGNNATITIFKETEHLVNQWYNMPYSRGGFLSNDTQIISKLDGCSRKKNEYFNFLYDGSMILCCMDYLRETVYGNVKYQTIKEVTSSNLYQKIQDSVYGENEVENFICKKCELARGIKIGN